MNYLLAVFWGLGTSTWNQAAAPQVLLDAETEWNLGQQSKRCLCSIGSSYLVCFVVWYMQNPLCCIWKTMFLCPQIPSLNKVSLFHIITSLFLLLLLKHTSEAYQHLFHRPAHMDQGQLLKLQQDARYFHLWNQTTLHQ